jgi:hypothetical protein
MMFSKTIVVYVKKHTKPKNKLCGQNAELLNAKAGVYTLLLSYEELTEEIFQFVLHRFSKCVL